MIDFFAFDSGVQTRLIASVVLLVVFAFLRVAATRLVRGKTTVLSDEQRQRLFYSRAVSNAILGFGLIAIWLTQLQHLAFSLTAVTVAVVIATKELLICLAGFLVRTGSRSFSVGDWIEVNGVRGEVVDLTPLTTTLLELDERRLGRDYTGRTTTIPNAWFVTHQVINETFGKNYAVHRFTLTVEKPYNISVARRFLETAAREAYKDYKDTAERYNALIERKLGVDLPGPEPQVTITTTDLGRIQFHILLFCPTSQVEAMQAKISDAFFDALCRREIPLLDAPNVAENPG